MIEIQNVFYTYEQAKQPSLQGINLSIRDGECVLLCGKSGCGKTTITRLLNGMIPDFYPGEFAGNIRVNGIDPVTCSMYEISKKVGTVFQNPRTQFYTVNTTSEIAFGCENHGKPSKEIQQRVAKAAEDLNISPLLNRNIFQLSGGEKQKIAFASIYAMNPDIYVLDEPSSNLDCFAIRELHTILKFLKSLGKTIILAEHRTWYLEGIVDRAVFMESGKIVREYSMNEIAGLSMQERIETGIRPVHLSKFSAPNKQQILTSHRLVTQDVQFSYKQQVSLKIPNEVFHAGNITAIIGRNGAGKSTFASVLCGVLKNQKGSISVDGVDLSSPKRISISYMVMQEVNHQLFTDSVEKEVTLGVQNPDPEKLADVFVQMDISELRYRHPMTLSGGQKQRVAVAAAMFCGKKILIFDEPTSGLDFSHMLQTAELLKQLKTPDAFIFVITHDYEFVLSACDDVTEIENGKIKATYQLNQSGLEKIAEYFLNS